MCTRRIVRLSLMLCGLLLFCGAAAQAQMISIGNIIIDSYGVSSDANGNLGVTINAHYDELIKQSCCSDIRWIQRVTTNKVTSVNPPNGDLTFIDPWKNQPIADLGR